MLRNLGITDNEEKRKPPMNGDFPEMIVAPRGIEPLSKV